MSISLNQRFKGGDAIFLDRDVGIITKTLKMGEKKWSFYLGFSLSDISLMKKKIYLFNTILFISALLVLAFAMMITLRHFAKPINELVAATNIIGKGDLAHRVNITSDDELGQLALGFNDMADKIQESDEKLTGIINSITDPMSIIDQEYNIIWTNKVGKDLFGPDLVGNKCHRAYYQREKPCEPCIGREVFHDGQIHEQEATVILADGSVRYFWCTANVARHYADGRPQTVIGLYRDITARKKAEEKIKESEEHYRLLADNLRDVLWTMDLTYTLTYVSPSVLQMTGYTPKEFISLGLRQIVLMAYHDVFVNTLPKLLAPEMPQFQTYEIEYRRKDGSIGWAEITVTLMHDSQDVPVGMAGVTRDISERKRAEKLLRQNEEWFRHIYDNSPVMMHSIDADGLVCNVNQKWLESLGYTRDEVIGKKIFQFMSVESAQRCRDTVLPHFWQGGLVRDIPYQFIKHDGAVMEALLDCTLTQDPSGKPVSLSVTRDVTDIKHAQEELRKSQEKLAGMINAMTDHMSLIDRDHNILWANEVAERLFGPDLVGKKCYRAYHHREEPCEPCIVSQVFQDDQTHEHETEVILADGSAKNFWCTASIGRRDPDGRTQGVIEISRDITARKQTEDGLRHATVQLQNILQEYSQRNMEIRSLNRLLELLQSCLSSGEAYPIIAQFSQELFPEISGALFVLDRDRNLVEAVAVWGESLSGELVFPPSDCWAFRQGAIHVPSQGIRCRHVSVTQGNYLCTPLTGLGESLGMLHLQAPGKLSKMLTDSTKLLAGSLANHIGLCLVNLKLRETMSYQVTHDHLTGLFNRRYLEETLEREISRVKRKGAPLGIIMLDLDNFKRFNDTYGHAAGDNLLRTLGKLLLQQVRQEDMPCRYGGEEFVLIMAEASLDVVQARAEAIRKLMPKLQVFQESQLLEGTTVSLGVAMFPEHGTTADDLLRVADDAMYRAKAAGRNRVVVAESNIELRAI